MPTPWLVGTWLIGSSLLKLLCLERPQGKLQPGHCSCSASWPGDLTMTDRMEGVWEGMQ